ncbi:uncharacterized protein LTR77_006561 [Saxophila tyrrhenica]|uniref:Luciferase domain-containing protein n=1 Tax=Saxophila tyrrhenica TaxID=1690608 RepID=A0AAV9P5W0_9PEZI|nr:hypothetical protein LTR77_006561 [Saxophila tyrrhenica]
MENGKMADMALDLPTPSTFTQISPVLTFTILLTFLPLSLRLYLDYLAYLALGPGGTPASLQGFLKVKLLGLFALRDPYSPRDRTQHGGYLHIGSKGLRKRRGPRPVVKGIAPQRQTTQKAPQAMFQRLASEIERMAAADDTLSIGTSCFEKHGTGLFLASTSPSRTGDLIAHTTHRCKHEIVHAHASDGSLHLTLHPADSRAVLEAGWGERHPLSRGGRFERFVPVDFVMIYAPRDSEEVEMVLRIISGARWFVGGKTGPVELEGKDGEDGMGRKDSGAVVVPEDASLAALINAAEVDKGGSHVVRVQEDLGVGDDVGSRAHFTSSNA